nr:hypothetical protein [Mesorhizobium sp.]
MDGLLLHDGFETYYAGKRKPREEKPRDDTRKSHAEAQTIMARPAKWPPRSKETSGEATNP